MLKNKTKILFVPFVQNFLIAPRICTHKRLAITQRCLGFESFEGIFSEQKLLQQPDTKACKIMSIFLLLRVSVNKGLYVLNRKNIFNLRMDQNAFDGLAPGPGRWQLDPYLSPDCKIPRTPLRLLDIKERRDEKLKEGGKKEGKEREGRAGEILRSANCK